MMKSLKKAIALAPVGREATWRMLKKRLYSVPELIRLTGMTRKQVEYWAAIGLLIPAMRNSKALGSQPASFYSAEGAIRALIMCDLRRRGFTPRQLKQVARNLKKQGRSLGDSRLYLLSDGYSVYYATSQDKVIDILKHNRQMLLVPVHEQIEKLMDVA
jgi:DNA-binding transcriptional MerR regulator